MWWLDDFLYFINDCTINILGGLNGYRDKTLIIKDVTFGFYKTAMGSPHGFNRQIYLLNTDKSLSQPYTSPCWFSTGLVPLWPCPLRSPGAACPQRRTAGLDKTWPAHSLSVSRSSQRGLQLRTNTTTQLERLHSAFPSIFNKPNRYNLPV